MNIVFMGTPIFAVPSLEKMIDKFNVSAVITQPDKKKGRGNKVLFPPIKEIALKYNIPVYQPEKIRKDSDLINKLKELKPDFIVVVAFGQILSQEILDIPKYGSVNLHASLLPDYRGAAPINFAIINGEKKAGNTTMLMDAGLDTGDMLLKDEVAITSDLTYGELHDILKERGADLLADTLTGYAKGEIKRIPQNKKDVFYAKMIDKEFCYINWLSSAKDISNFVRGLSPIPCAKTHYQGKMMKIYKIRITDEDSKAAPGTITRYDKSGIYTATLDKNIIIEDIQMEGGKRLLVSEYLKGHNININDVLD
jgi:methionyl-tRNA formyltransferase